MIQSGLVSITFRSLSPREIVDLVKAARLDAIEWGGDVHVPHGDIDRAREVRAMMEDAGIAASSYGSYYRLRGDEEEGVPFAAVLETALALGAPLVRVWAGKRGSADADAAYRDLIVQESRRAADLAGAEGVQIAYEYHGGTLTDTLESTLDLIGAVDRSNVRTYWQPPQALSVGERLAGLESVLPWLANLHVFQWEDGERVPLMRGKSEWARYLTKADEAEGARYALLEFVQDDAPPNFLRDAATLREWLA